MMTGQDDCGNSVVESRRKEEKEKILVAVRCYKHNDKEKLSADNDKYRLFEIPHRWYIY
jgi:hypothetical protein